MNSVSLLWYRSDCKGALIQYVLESAGGAGAGAAGTGAASAGAASAGAAGAGAAGAAGAGAAAAVLVGNVGAADC